MSEELNLIGNRYNVAVVIFFVPYCTLEIPSNILLKKFKPHVWLGLNMFGFGVRILGRDVDSRLLLPAPLQLSPFPRARSLS